jgi:DNA-binding GntR family transcriptional regulator
MILKGVPQVFADQDCSVSHIRKQVARILLERSADTAHGRSQLSQREIATMLGVGWEMVHLSLKSLYTEGIIRLERNRLIIKKTLLQQLAGITKPV